LFVFGAGVAGFMFLANLLLLRESRTDEGHAEAVANPTNVFCGAHSAPRSLAALVLPLLRSRAFVMVCLLSFAATMVRETFNTWSPQYLRDFAGFTVSHAASMSAIFPAVGAVSVLLAGWGSDRLGPNARSLLLCVGLAATAAALLVLMSLRGGAGGLLPVTMIGVVAFCLLGPYSFLPGAFALDFGGKQGGAVASGMVDGTGYLGGVAAGTVMARLSVVFGWGGVFVALAVMSVLAALGACYLYVLNGRRLSAPAALAVAGPG
jgi:OPA family glycerol-3-phosphate transporter-like MFS transporter